MTTAVRNLIKSYAPGTTFTDILWDCSHPADDCVAWHIALESADLHSCLYDFRKDYGHLQGERIDCGELLTWLGY
jgi:hypothetical protein